MVELRSLGLCVLLFCVCMDFALGNNIKGHGNHVLGHYQNSATRNKEGEAVPGREEKERGEQIPGARDPVSEQGEQIPGRGEQVPGQREQNQGRGEQDQGRGKQDQGRGEQDQGRGEQDQGRGKQDQGRGKQDQGRGEQDQGRGKQDQGRGEQDQGRGEQDQGRGKQDPGQGEEEAPRRGEPVPERPGSESGVNGKACLCECAGAPGKPHISYEHVMGMGYYKYHNKAKNWWGAKRECEKEGAHLAIINSPEERDAILKIYKKKPLLVKNPAVFVGINDLAHEGAWVTVFDVPLKETGFEQWNINEPLGKTTQNCGTLQAEFGKLHDHECHNELGFICEREMNYVRHCV